MLMQISLDMGRVEKLIGIQQHAQCSDDGTFVRSRHAMVTLMPPNSGSEKNNRRKLGVSGLYYGTKLLSPVFDFGSKISRVSVSKDPAHEKNAS